MNRRSKWMQRIGPAVAALILLPCAGAQDADAPSELEFTPIRKFPAGGELLKRIRARLPRQAMTIHADLKAQPKGGEETTRRAVIQLAWGRPIPVAVYTLEDAFGKPVEQLKVAYPGTVQPSYVYGRGEKLEPVAGFDLHRPIEGLPLSWADLSLSFLWWKDGKTLGKQIKRARDCYIVEVPVPAWDSGSPYAFFRLWVDTREHFIIEAEAYGADRELLKEIKAKSIEKISGVWMVKDLEITAHPSRDRTKVLVRDMDVQPEPESGGVISEEVDSVKPEPASGPERPAPAP